MKFLLTLHADIQIFGNKLPLSYQYELSAFIYHTLALANKEYAAWLHQNGFNTNDKRFKLFTFSNLIFPAYKITGDRIEILSQKAGLIISFLPERSTEEFIKGVFSKQNFCIGDKLSKVQFTIAGIEVLAAPDFSGPIQYNTLSPVCITRHQTEPYRIIYESPESNYAHDALKVNLLNKYKAFYGKEFEAPVEFGMAVNSKIRSKLITIKTNTAQETKVKGYLCDFTLRTNQALARIIYYAGLGEKNALGFGCVETRENLKTIRERLAK